MTNENLSGIIKVENFSGGVARSNTPNTIPSISFSDMQNYDIEDSALITRKGVVKYGNALRPGCLQFGFSDDQRCHFNRVWEGRYFGSDIPNTGNIWNMFFYAKDLTATTGERTFLTYADVDGDELGKIWYDTDGNLNHRFKPKDSEAFNTLTQSTGTTRGTTSDYLYGVSLAFKGAGEVQQSLYNADGLIATQSLSIPYLNFKGITDITLGCDSNIKYPSEDPYNASNTALYGLMGELAITKNVSPTATTYVSNFQVLPPCYNVADENKIAYYPFRTDYDDEWGNNPSFRSNDIFRRGAGLTHYMIRDNNIPGIAKDPLYCTHSWHVDTYNTKKYGHIYGVQDASTGGIEDYDRLTSVLNPSNSGYTITMDILPIKCATGTTYSNIYSTVRDRDGSTALTLGGGPDISLSYENASNIKVRYRHRYNAANSTEISTLIPYKKSTKLIFSFESDGVVDYTQRIHRDLGLVATTINTGVGVASEVVAPILGYSGGEAASGQEIDYYFSGVIIQSADVATSWAERPQENLSQITTYETIPDRTANFLGSKILLRGTTTTETKVERTGQDISFGNIMELPRYDTVHSMFLFHEVTGYDSATTLDYHGKVRNLVRPVATTNDFRLVNNTCPIWVADRKALTSTGYLDDVYDLEPDRVTQYSSTDTTVKDVLVVRNNSITSYTATTHVLNDYFSYSARLDTQMRWFNYGQSMYGHGRDYNLRYNGLSMIPAQSPTAGMPLKLTAVTNGGVGLRGYYKYAYTFMDKNGIESYPCLAVGTTVNSKKIGVSCDLNITSSSWIDESIETVRFYRNKGTTTNLTSLTHDASAEMYYLRELPMETIRNNAGTTWFTDGIADSALGAQPPLPGFADKVPPSKYSTIYNDTIYYTGNTFEPTMVYSSVPEIPFLLDRADEYRTEDGEKTSGIASNGRGVIVFKETGRKYYNGGFSPEKPFEFDNGGCVSHDSLVSIGGGRVIGLGSNGFFITDGHGYQDITRIIDDGRLVSTLQYDFDEVLSLADMRKARAVYHEPTSRYLCKIGTTVYVFELKRRRWLIYKDFIGDMVVQNSSLLTYVNGRFYKEVSNQAFVGTGKWTGTIDSGGLGYVNITNSTALPTSDEEGLPIYIGKTLYWVRNITLISGTTYKVEMDTNVTFSSGKYALGVMRHYADTKFFDVRTPGRNVWFGPKLVVQHDNAANGEIAIRTARNNGSFDDSYDHFLADTNIDKIETIVRVRSENMALRFEIMDGVKHSLRSFQLEYRQDSVG